MTPAWRESYMQLALAQAEAAGQRSEVPVGAVIVAADGTLLASAGNRTREQHDPTAHAELIVIREACALLATERLEACDIYVTLEPCTMCAAAISLARLRRVYFAAPDPKGGGIEHGARVFTHPTCHHVPEVYSGLDETRASQLLKNFFSSLR